MVQNYSSCHFKPQSLVLVGVSLGLVMPSYWHISAGPRALLEMLFEALGQQTAPVKQSQVKLLAGVESHRDLSEAQPLEPPVSSLIKGSQCHPL